MSKAHTSNEVFFGWRVVGRAFVLAIFGWGLGFYGPAVYLHGILQTHDWPMTWVSTAVTVHFLSGAVIIARLPKLYDKFGLKTVTRVGAIMFSLGLCGWAFVGNAYALFAAAIFTGCGWVTMGAAAINAIISPWFIHQRPKALSMAYNGASVGGLVFSPLLVLLMTAIGFQATSIAVFVFIVVSVWWLTAGFFGHPPQHYQQHPDGQEPENPTEILVSTRNSTLGKQALWKDTCFLSLTFAMALGLFAQVGLLAHLFSLIVPTFGAQGAGLAIALATASAIMGRTIFGWCLNYFQNRRLAASYSLLIQVTGVTLIGIADGQSAAISLFGLILFGFGIGNATSLPPLIAQMEFSKDDAAMAIPMMIAIAQATYAFAPAVFGFVRVANENGVFILAVSVKIAAILGYLYTKRHRSAGF